MPSAPRAIVEIRFGRLACRKAVLNPGQVLRVGRSNVVGGTRLVPVPQSAYGGPHPLVETTVASGANGVALIWLRTEFVDVTPFWKAYSVMSDYQREHDGSLDPFVALGYTGQGGPPIWFAIYPPACRTPSRQEVGCLAYYSHRVVPYTKLDELHEQGQLDRFLLSPIPSDPAYWKHDRFAFDPPPDPFLFLRCGFEQALAQSGKAVVMLLPWPVCDARSKVDFGDARGPLLPDLAAAAIRFLWAKQQIGRNTAGVRLGRLGISGYSSGGEAFWRSLWTNSASIAEAYSFDALGAVNGVPIAKRWFAMAPDARCLRMASGNQMKEHTAIRSALDPGGTNPRITLLPPSDRSYDAGSNLRWDHMLSELRDKDPVLAEECRKSLAVRHEFAMFGGYQAGTFLGTFLARSDF